MLAREDIKIYLKENFSQLKQWNVLVVERKLKGRGGLRLLDVITVSSFTTEKKGENIGKHNMHDFDEEYFEDGLSPVYRVCKKCSRAYVPTRVRQTKCLICTPKQPKNYLKPELFMLKIYSTPNCKYCKIAKEYFTKHKVPFKEINVSEDKEALSLIIDRTGKRSVPTFEIDGNWVVGWQEETIKELLKD